MNHWLGGHSKSLDKEIVKILECGNTFDEKYSLLEMDDIYTRKRYKIKNTKSKGDK